MVKTMGWMAMMNGTGEQIMHAESAGGSPIVTINQINLTGRQILSIGSMLIGAIMTAYTAGWLFLPAKQKEFEALNQTVAVMQQQFSESRAAITRLTVAVDNMSGIITELKNSAAPRAKTR